MPTSQRERSGNFLTTFSGQQNPEVGRVSWLDNTVWLDAPSTKKGRDAAGGTVAFVGVPRAVWDFYIGGYRVCEKWLKDRKGRTLSREDVANYQKIVVALAETIRIMEEVDEVIDQRGGLAGRVPQGDLAARSWTVMG